MYKTIANTVLAGLSLVATSCARDPMQSEEWGETYTQYSFKGDIEEEYVSFGSYRSNKNILKVTSKDGKTRIYTDISFPHKPYEVDEFFIRDSDETTHSKYKLEDLDPISRAIMQQAQEQFDDYLIKIWEKKNGITLEEFLKKFQ